MDVNFHVVKMTRHEPTEAKSSGGRGDKIKNMNLEIFRIANSFVILNDGLQPSLSYLETALNMRGIFPSKRRLKTLNHQFMAEVSTIRFVRE